MPFAQTTFLGASVSKFSSSLGWGREPSKLSVTLVEDPKRGDLFVPGLVGRPVFFECGQFTFGGWLQSWTKRDDSDGSPVYPVNIIDPREILSGTQLIIDGYNGGIYDVPNIYNVYGALESLYGFGGAQVDEAGMPWYLLYSGFVGLQAANPLMFRNIPYYIDLSDLPSPPSYFRIGGSSITLMEFVEQICDAMNHDFFFTLNQVLGRNYISISTIDRRVQPDLNKMYDFIVANEASSKEVGIELRNETTSKFLVGGQLEGLQYITNDLGDINGTQPTGLVGNKHYDVGNDDIGQYLYHVPDLNDDYSDINVSVYDDTIIPYWGTYYSDQSTIIGKYSLESEYTYGIYRDDVLPPVFDRQYIPHRFRIDLLPLFPKYFTPPYRFDNSPMQLQHGIPYNTDVDELRHVLAGQAEWETFLAVMSGPPKVGAVYNGTAWIGGSINNIHHYKASFLGLGVDMNPIKTIIDASGEYAPMFGRAYGVKTFRLKSEAETYETDQEKEIRKLYEYLKTYATEFFGTKFMVTIPNVYVKKIYDGITPNDDILSTSLEPIDSGYLDESSFANAINSGYLPYDVNKFLTEDNKIVGYVRFDYIYRRNENPAVLDSDGNPVVEDAAKGFFDLDQLNPEDYTTWQNNLYVKCSIDPKIVFLDRANLQYPRVVITLPNPIYKKVNKTLTLEPIRAILSSFALPSDKIREISAKASISSNYANLPPMPCIPDVAVVPLRDKTQTYGPWYISGAQGKTEFEQDESLVPWNFGGFTLMNSVAMAKVTESASNYQAGETGNITLPGLPTVNLGAALITSGPYVTDMNIDIGPNGVTTTYNMQTWTWRRSGAEKSRIETQKKLINENQKRRKEIRTLFNSRLNQAEPKSLAKYDIIGKGGFPEELSPHSLSPLMAAEISEDKTTEIFMCKEVDIRRNIYVNFEKKAVVSLDTLFRPFSTASGVAVDNFNGPHMLAPTNTTDINADDLNPFTTYTDYMFLTANSGMPPEGLMHKYADQTKREFFRGIGLRAPLMMVGWGYDINDKPVPNSNPNSPTDNFATNYKTRPDLWKVGPLDSRWDEARGVWVAGGSQIKIGKIDNNIIINHNASGLVSIFNDGIDTYQDVNCKNITGVALSGLLQVRIDYVSGYSLPLISPYEWDICNE